MKLYFSLLLIVATLIQKSIESCMVEDSSERPSHLASLFYDFQPAIIEFEGYSNFHPKYIECQNETITQDLFMKINKFLTGPRIERVEIKNFDNVRLPKGSFTSLRRIPEIRIIEGNLELIEDQAFEGLTELMILSLKNNKIRNLGAECFSGLPNLVKMDLSGNRIDDIEDGAFAPMKMLQTMILSNNSLTKVRKKTFENLTRVEFLCLSFNGISQIDDEAFKNLTHLNTLYLDHNHLTQINENLIVNNNRLKVLDISYNFLKELNNITLYQLYYSLKVNNNYFKNIQFANFTRIASFDLSNNEIILSDDSFKNIAVIDLNLENNFIGESNSLGKVFSNLTTLKKISLQKNQIKILSENIFQNNTDLEEVNLSDNYLQNLIKFPISLQTLNVSNNFLNSSISLNYLINLEYLDISFNNFTLISYHLFDNLKSLYYLSIRNNHINKIDVGCFREAKLLRELDLSNNKIKILEIGVFVGIDNLNKLDISHNKLNVISDGVFHNLRHLQVLNAAYNNISFLSVENTLSHMVGLREINLAGNQWSCSFLITVIKDFGKIKIVGGSDINITNVNGISCQNNIPTNTNTIDYRFIDKITSNQVLTNSLLFIVVIIIIIKLLLKYYKICIQKSKKIIGKNPTEQELPLI